MVAVTVAVPPEMGMVNDRLLLASIVPVANISWVEDTHGDAEGDIARKVPVTVLPEDCSAPVKL